MTKAVWFGSNTDADLALLVQHAADWADVRDQIQCFILHGDNLMHDTPESGNRWQRTLASGFLPFLKQHSVPLVVEIGVIKEWSLDGVAARQDALPRIISRVAEAGGELSGIAMDEPLKFGDVPYSTVLSGTVEFVKACKGYGLGCALIAAYPFCTAPEVADFYRDIEAQAGPLGGLIMDVDYRYQVGTRRCGFLGLRRCPVIISRDTIAADLNYLQHDRQIPLNVIAMAIQATDDVGYRSEAIDWTRFVSWSGRAVTVWSWREVPSATNKQLPTDIPYPYHMDVARVALSLADERARPGAPPPVIVVPPIEPPPTPQVPEAHNFFGRGAYVGCSDFRLLQLQMLGQDIRPLLDQRKAAGIRLARVFAMKANNTGWELNPDGRGDFSGDVRRFFDTLGTIDFGCELNVFADTALLPGWDNPAKQQEFFGRIVETVRPYAGSVLWCLRLLNEYGHGTLAIDPAAFAKPSGVIFSRGAGTTDVQPPQPFGDCAHYSARREPYPPSPKPFTNYNPFVFRDGDPWPMPCPFIPSEGVKPTSNKPDHYNADPAYAEMMGRAARVGWGGTWHSSQGVNSEVWPANVEACARAFVQGLRG